MHRTWLKSRSHDIAALVILILLIAVTIWIRLWRQPGLDDWDVMTYYLPSYAFLGEHIRHFSLPGWNPHLFSGTPFAANPQSGWSYLPAMSIFALFSPMTAFRVLIAFHMVLGGVTTFIFARLLRIGMIGALAAAIVFTFGQNLGASTCCTNQAQLNAWIPLALIGVEVATLATTWRARCFFLSITAVAASQMIAGWVGEGMYNALLLVGAYLAFRTLGIGASWRRRFLALALNGGVVFVLGVALSAAGLMPRLAFAPRTYVGTAAYQSEVTTAKTYWDVAWVIQTLTSYNHQWRPYYLGSAAIACIAISMFALRRNRAAIFFLGFLLVVVVLPMRPTPIHWVFYLLPKYRGLHSHDPGRVMAILPIGIAMLVATGIDSLPEVFRRRGVLLIASAPALLYIAPLVVFTSDFNAVTGMTWVILGFALATLLGGGLVASGRVAARKISFKRAVLAVQASLIALLFFDPTGVALFQTIHNRTYVEAGYTKVKSSSVLSTQTSSSDDGGAGEFLRKLQNDGQEFRFFGYVSPPFRPKWYLHEHYMDAGILPLLANNRAMRLGLDDVQGYDPAHLTIYRDFFSKLNYFERDYHEELVYPAGIDSPLLNLLNVRYVIVPLAQTGIDPVRYREVFRNGQVRVLENLQALPRAWLVHADQQSPSPQTAIDALTAPGFDPKMTAMLQTAPPTLVRPTDPAADSVKVTAMSDDAISLSVHAESAGLVVLSEIYDPDWNVYVDGKKSTVYQTDAVLRSVAVSAGDHTVEFRYESRPLKLGMLISTAAALLVFAIAVWAAFGWLQDFRRRSANRDISAPLN